MENSNTPVVCLYHNSCIDGMVAASIIWSIHPGENAAEFIAVDYSDNHALNLAGKFTGKYVYIVDFSIDPEILLPLIKYAAGVTMIDHHKTAIKKWEGIDLPSHMEVVFDDTKSGARLTWEYAWPNSPVPPAVLHVEDRDLWKFAHPGTANHMAYFRAQPWMRLGQFKEIFNHISDHTQNLDYRATVLLEGRAIVMARDEMIHDILKSATNYVSILGLQVPVAAVPKAIHSEAGQILYDSHPDAPFVITYSDIRSRGVREYSFRSRKDEGANVRIVAEILHGGGHDHAAGVAVPMDDRELLEHLTSLMVEERTAYRDEFYPKLEAIIRKHWYDFSKEASGSEAAKEFFQHGLVGK